MSYRADWDAEDYEREIGAVHRELLKVREREARLQRDVQDLIKAGVKVGLTQRRVVELTGLSRQRIGQIVNNPAPEPKQA